MTVRQQLARDSQGVTTIEFAMVMPVFLLALVGCLDLGQMVYAIGVLDGAVEKAARDSTLETGNTANADAAVTSAVEKILPGARISSTRKSYFDFAHVSRGEPLNDTNGDGLCSTGEGYTDENGNGSWDDDLGRTGNGGANDVIVYTVNVRYDPVFAIPFVPIDWREREISSTAVKRNQPYALQEGGYGSTARVC
ncbi:TadE/TadG family type IV pilus assembly protein [Novosphingobium taihuense]|uniref:Flp pilus assembly protein TadG n=1 Tax=Novosphingobium taihuense TaxID=260085 RepID=A0A7W7A8L4_9SPHN|nr:TadE/TadG family type IV pilus assembly protein [Novosphingobium taihuense]MBB4612403.1 Flp pilus assembly protein TadG [Novosphingobium taihuense]TWH88245.1 Flp pilus assembly protein TadG [Novosphingobium taihuense]